MPSMPDPCIPMWAHIDEFEKKVVNAAKLNQTMRERHAAAKAPELKEAYELMMNGTLKLYNYYKSQLEKNIKTCKVTETRETCAKAKKPCISRVLEHFEVAESRNKSWLKRGHKRRSQSRSTETRNRRKHLRRKKSTSKSNTRHRLKSKHRHN